MFQNIHDKLKDLTVFLQEVKFESNEIDMDEFLGIYKPEEPNQNKLHVKKYKDAIYIGELNETLQRHGKGIMLYHTGRRYEGSWHSDLRHSRGYEKHASGNTYTG